MSVAALTTARWRQPATLRGWLLPMLAVLLLLSSGVILDIGPVTTSLLSQLAELLGMGAATATDNSLQTAVLWQLRLPRLCLALLSGAVLGLAGAVLQGMFRNPLADPGLIGVSSGAALAAGLVIVFAGAMISPLALPLAAFSGGLIAALLVLRIGRFRGATSVATLLLAGIAINAIAGAGLGLLSYLSDDNELRSLTFWLLGSMARARWADLLPTLPFFLLPLILLPREGRALNALLLGEAEARHLGINVERLKLRLVLWSTVGVGACVALTGIVGFVGLVVPHLIRMLVGPDHRLLLPASACGGALLVIWADALARSIVSPAELPIGILTTLVGGPFFIALLLRQRAGVTQ